MDNTQIIQGMRLYLEHGSDVDTPLREQIEIFISYLEGKSSIPEYLIDGATSSLNEAFNDILHNNLESSSVGRAMKVANFANYISDNFVLNIFKSCIREYIHKTYKEYISTMLFRYNLFSYLSIGYKNIKDKIREYIVNDLIGKLLQHESSIERIFRSVKDYQEHFIQKNIPVDSFIRTLVMNVYSEIKIK